MASFVKCVGLCYHDTLAEWSKALASGASPQGRGFEPHRCHNLELVGWSGAAQHRPLCQHDLHKRFHVDSSQRKRPALPHQPNLYLEPKWLRCQIRIRAGKVTFQRVAPDQSQTNRTSRRHAKGTHMATHRHNEAQRDSRRHNATQRNMKTPSDAHRNTTMH